MIRHRKRALEAASCSTRELAGRSVGKKSTQLGTNMGPASGYWSCARVSAETNLVLRMSITSTAKLKTSVFSKGNGTVFSMGNGIDKNARPAPTQIYTHGPAG